METKKWHIKIEFDWDAWEGLTEASVKSKVSDLFPFVVNVEVKLASNQVELNQ